VDDPGSSPEAEEHKPPSPWRSIALTFAFAGVFAALLLAYLLPSMKAPVGPVLVETSDAARSGPDTLEIAQRAAGAFVEALHVGDVEGAYAQMARPYRESATLASFRAAWKTPLLAAPRAVMLSRSFDSSTPINGRLVRAATFSARGMLVAAAGALDTTFTFLREGGDARVLAVFVGGVPVVQGLGPSAPRN
jgi:hypothetical protein